ncbi:MAG: phosphoglycerate dehydrogenase [Chloroflexi bacterium]|nr:phosphoglycerate dehydrogenase [Chloroflexota bacterium]
MFRILISDKLGQAGLDRLAEAEDVIFDVKTGLSKEELIKIIPDYHGLIVRSGTKPDADILAAGKNLKVVGRAGIGVDNVDIRAATMNGIIVMNTPQANSIATAEQALTLMLAVSRHTAQSHSSLKDGEWKRSQFAGTQLYRKVLGIIGFGRIGRLVSERAQAFGMEVIAYDPFVSEEVGHDLGVTLVDLEDLLGQADYISLHTALLPATHNLINAKTISQMKDGVVFINAARGKLVDEQALADGLKSGKIKAAGIDVYISEPPENSPLIGLPNVVHTPHLGASTVEAQRDVATQIADQVLSALRGTDFPHAINLPFPPGLDFKAARPYIELGEKLGKLQAHLANGPITKIEIDARGGLEEEMIRPIAAGVLKGVLENFISEPVNYINAPILAEENGISMSQAKGIGSVDYPSLVYCRVHWEGGGRLVGGVLFGEGSPRIVQVDEYHIEARPEGYLLVLKNMDVPGVIGQVGTLLAEYEVNVGEWRMGRNEPGGVALSFINMDSNPPEAVLDALARIPSLKWVKLICL